MSLRSCQARLVKFFLVVFLLTVPGALSFLLLSTLLLEAKSSEFSASHQSQKVKDDFSEFRVRNYGDPVLGERFTPANPIDYDKEYNVTTFGGAFF